MNQKSLRNLTTIKLTDQPQHVSHKNTFGMPSQIQRYIAPMSNLSDSQSMNPQAKFLSWLKDKRSFSKPNTQFSQYADNVSRHKKLVRRGIFNTPALKENFLSKEVTFNQKKISTQFSSPNLLHTSIKKRQNQNIESQQNSIPNQKYLPSLSEINISRLKSLSHSKLIQTQIYSDSEALDKIRKMRKKLDLQRNNFRQQKLINKDSKSLFKFSTISTQIPKISQKQRNLNEKDQNPNILRNSMKRLIDSQFITEKLSKKENFHGNKLLKLQKKHKF